MSTFTNGRAKFEFSDISINFRGSGGSPAQPMAGVYIFSRQDGRHFIPIYVGESTNIAQRMRSHERIDCIRDSGANYFHTYQVSAADTRQSIEQGLIAYYHPHCNR